MRLDIQGLQQQTDIPVGYRYIDREKKQNKKTEKYRKTLFYNDKNDIQCDAVRWEQLKNLHLFQEAITSNLWILS